MGKSGSYIYKLEIPVTVIYSTRDDGSISVDSVSVPDEDVLYKMVDANAMKIMVGAEVRSR